MATNDIASQLGRKLIAIAPGFMTSPSAAACDTGAGGGWFSEA